MKNTIIFILFFPAFILGQKIELTKRIYSVNLVKGEFVYPVSKIDSLPLEITGKSLCNCEDSIIQSNYWKIDSISEDFFIGKKVISYLRDTLEIPVSEEDVDYYYENSWEEVSFFKEKKKKYVVFEKENEIKKNIFYYDSLQNLIFTPVENCNFRRSNLMNLGLLFVSVVGVLSPFTEVNYPYVNLSLGLVSAYGTYYIYKSNRIVYHDLTDWEIKVKK